MYSIPFTFTDGLSRVNTLKCTREELVENLSSFMSESNQNFIVKPHAEVTDAVVIVEDKVKGETATESSPQGYVVVGEMCGLAVMRGAQVFSPGLSLNIILGQSDQDFVQAFSASRHLIFR